MKWLASILAGAILFALGAVIGYARAEYVWYEATREQGNLLGWARALIEQGHGSSPEWARSADRFLESSPWGRE